ncbi:hypothetical protein E4U61_001555 [Claviceps capensis]|nr:hypothetical protein E4U61_001555 [Claviceps capensis]
MWSPVDSRGTLINLIDSIKNLPTLYVDLEGSQLSRNGTISIVTLYATTLAIAYMVDVHKLGKSAFTRPNESPISKAEKMKWDQLKKSTTCLFDPNKGGRYEVFNERPFRDGI